MKQRIFSGIQPSGSLHIGNYLGAIKNWVKMYEKYDSIFCVVDLHAITVPQKSEELKRRIIDIAKTYLAAGIDPQKAIIFVQSEVPAHCELMWILNTLSKTGELFKMTQFKDKAKLREGGFDHISSIDVGLMNYPILMAADILLYDTEVVPVGEDQVQHVELSRILGKRFNHRFGEIFKIPQVHINKEGMRIMGLDNPKNKMSKSAESKYNRIELMDSEEEIREKIKRAVTDSGRTIEYRDNRLALRNLINIFSLTTDRKPMKIVADYEGKGYKEFKEGLAEAVVNFLQPFQKRYNQISNEEVLSILKNGAQRASLIAEKKIKKVKEKVGLGTNNQ